MTLYLIRAGCPHCGELADLVERTDAPIGLMQDVPIETEYCHHCGGHVAPGMWDVAEDHEIERVAPAEERGLA